MWRQTDGCHQRIIHNCFPIRPKRGSFYFIAIGSTLLHNAQMHIYVLIIKEKRFAPVLEIPHLPILTCNINLSMYKSMHHSFFKVSLIAWEREIKFFSRWVRIMTVLVQQQEVNLLKAKTWLSYILTWIFSMCHMMSKCSPSLCLSLRLTAGRNCKQDASKNKLQWIIFYKV